MQGRPEEHAVNSLHALTGRSLRFEHGLAMDIEALAPKLQLGSTVLKALAFIKLAGKLELPRCGFPSWSLGTSGKSDSRGDPEEHAVNSFALFAWFVPRGRINSLRTLRVVEHGLARWTRSYLTGNAASVTAAERKIRIENA